MPTIIAKTSCAIMLSLLLISCGGSGDTTSSIPPNETPTPTPTPSVPETPPAQDTSEHTISVNNHPQNTLMAQVAVTTTENTLVSLEYQAQGIAAKETYQSDSSKAHAFTLVGLRANTTYTITANITNEQSQTVTSQSQTLTTGALPTDAPMVELVNGSAQSNGGITFFASTTAPSRFYGVDESGEYVWYLHQDVPMSVSPTIKVLTDGRLMLLLSREVRLIDITGQTLATYSLPAYHHDAVLLSNNNLLILTSEVQTHNGEQLKGDKILELTPQGDTVWQWSSFDHLDTSRFPGALANRVINGQKDWTHSNALFYIEHDDTIMLSSRSQSWVININHSSGDIEWILGDSQSASVPASDKFFNLTSGTWMASQHAAMLTSLGDILLYDNRNEAELAGATNYSRAVRYDLNTSAMTAQQTWQYVAPKYTQSLGDVDELSNGNVLITAGGPGTHNDAHIIEVDSQSQEIWHIAIADTSVYRAERIEWSQILAPRSTQANQPSVPTTPTGNVNANGTTMLQVEGCSQASHFVDTNDRNNYIDYNLDGQTNADLYGDNLTPTVAVTCDENSVTVTSNGATNFDWVNLGQGGAIPNAGAYQWVIPKSPTLTNTTQSIPLLGVVGFTVTGIQIFGPNENAADNYADPVTDGLLNYCGGHTRQYHFHERAKCFFQWQTLGGADSLLPAQTANVVLGYALDGFPIMSPYQCSDQACTLAIKVESSYRYTGSGDYANENAWDNHQYEESLSPLDQCNGMIDQNGNYAYYATDTFPYYMACYRGPTDYVSVNNPRFGQ